MDNYTAVPVSLYSAEPKWIPKRRPRTARYLGSLAWYWSPAHSRCDHLYVSLSRDRRHWVLWIEWTDEHGNEAQVRSYMGKDGRRLGEIAGALVKVAYQSEEKESDKLGRPDEAAASLLTDKDWQRILQELWP